MERYLVIVCLGEVFIDTPERGHGFGDWEFLVYADSPEQVKRSTAYAIGKTIAACFDERLQEYHFYCGVDKTVQEKCWCCGKMCDKEKMTVVESLDTGVMSYYCPWCAEGMLEVLYMENLDSDIEVYYPQE